MLLCGYITSLSFSSTLVSFLTVITYPKLDHLVESLLQWEGTLGTTGYGNPYESLANALNPNIRKLVSKYEPVHTSQEGIALASKGNYAYMSSQITAQFAIQTQFTNRLVAGGVHCPKYVILW